MILIRSSQVLRFALGLVFTVLPASTAPGCFSPLDGSGASGSAGDGGGAGQGRGGVSAQSGMPGASGASGTNIGGSSGGEGSVGGLAGTAGATASGGNAGAPAGGLGAAGAGGSEGGALANGGGAGVAGLAGGGVAGALAPGPVCAGKYCAAGEYCCNPSCGTCAPMGQGCLAMECDRVRCGRELCPSGVACCSASCGQCRNDCPSIETCQPNCTRMDASPQGMSAALLGWFWDGAKCVSHNAQRCNGANCEDAFASREECESVFLACVEP